MTRADNHIYKMNGEMMLTVEYYEELCVLRNYFVDQC